jgi:sugar phosphate isomerase/epimerase
LHPETNVESFLPFLEAGAELGARHVVTAAYDLDRGRLIDRFGALCDFAAPFRLTIDIEFFPWTHVANLSQAAAVVAVADRTNSGILVDTLHFDRSASTIEQLDSVPPHGYHLCISATLRRRNQPRRRQRSSQLEPSGCLQAKAASISGASCGTCRRVSPSPSRYPWTS